MRSLVLIRHTKCAIAPGVCYGQLDLALAASAVDDIAQTLAHTPALDFIFTSPAQRCRRLADALAARDSCPIEVLDGLKELNFGDWEGRNWDAIDRAESEPWAADPWTRAPPNGESEMQLWQRAERVAQELLACPGNSLGVVAHAGPLRLLRCLLLGLPLEERWSWTLGLGDVERISRVATPITSHHSR